MNEPIKTPICLPDYVCVGFPKCATTFIIHSLKRAGFDTLTKHEFSLQRMSEFQDRIKEIHEEGGKVAIKNPNIIYSHENMDYLLSNNIKIIVSIRHPIRWIKSFYNYRLERYRSGKEVPPGDGIRIPEFSEIVGSGTKWWGVSTANGMMSEFIKANLLDNPLCKNENVHFVVQEELEASPDLVLSKMSEFVGSSNVVAAKNLKAERKIRRELGYSEFSDDSFDTTLGEIFQDEVKAICDLIYNTKGKDLQKIWKNFE